MPNGMSSETFDLDDLAEAAAIFAGAARIGAVFLAPEQHGRDRLGDLDRHVAHAAGEGRGRQAVELGPGAGAAGMEAGDVERRGLCNAAPDRHRRGPCRPSARTFHRHDVPSAGTPSVMACCRQPNTTSGSNWPMTLRAATGAGCWALRMQPSGAVTGSWRAKRRCWARAAPRCIDAKARIGLGVAERHVDAVLHCAGGRRNRHRYHPARW